ncbi:MAG: P-loop NTPase fold protein [Methylobacter sp.]|nr:P-loop NTPase fold protein [Methylobacter sp.]
MSLAPRSPRKVFIALFLFLAVLAWSLMQTNEYFVNGKGLDSDWLNPQTWLKPLSNHEALGQVGVNVGDLNDVAFIDSQHGWAVGLNGIILATDNGGQSWQQQQSSVATTLYAVQFTDLQHGWVAGSDGVILVTDNVGQSWRPQQSGVTTALAAVQFADPQHGWAVGENGVILATDNGGQSWQPQQSGATILFKAVQFTDPQHGWVVGSDGIILATDNGGTTWQNRSLPLLKAIGESRPKLAVFPSSLVLLLLLLTGSLVIRHTYSYYAEPRRLQGGINDAPVTQAQEDCLGRLELVKTLADLIRNRDTVPPLAIAITAPWGSGKSSVLGLLQHELQGEVFAVQLNAWHYRDDGQLLAALMEHVREQALPPMLSLDNLVFRSRLLWFRCFAGSGFRGLAAVLAGLTTTVFFAKQQQWQILGDWLSRELPALIPAWLKMSVTEPWFKLIFAVLAALLVYRLLKSWLATFCAFSPELVALASRLGKSAKEAMQVADWSKDAGLRFRFARDFETVAKALGKGRLLLLIDDLDRCEPKQIESVMTTLNFLFSTPAPCYAVLAMDWEYVTDALGVAFKDLAVARADTDTKGKAFAEHYLEKIIQISIDLPAVNGSRVALIDRTQRKAEEVVDWWGKLTKYWPRLAYSPSQRWACLAFAMLQSPLRLLVSVVWRGLELGLWMCWQAIKRFNRKMLTPVYDGLFILVLASALAFAGVHLGLVAQDFASQSLKSVNVVESKLPVVELAKNAKPEPEKKPIESSGPKSAAAPVVFVDEQLYPTHYWLWDFAGGLSLILLLMVWRLSLQVQDTQVFIEVMSQWQLWLAEHHKTPRDWKRLLNRARLFDMRVRVYQEKPWYAALDEKWQAWRFRRQPLPVPFQHDEINERLAMHLLMLDVYTQGELATSVMQFFAYNKNSDSFNRLNDALMKRPNNLPELKTLMSDLDYRNNEKTDERFAALEKAEGQLYLWFSLYAGLNTLHL